MKILFRTSGGSNPKNEYMKYFEFLNISKFNNSYIEFFSKIEKKYIEMNRIKDFIKLIYK